MPNGKPKARGEPVLVVFITSSKGVAEVQIHASRDARSLGDELYDRLRPAIDRLDRLARVGGG